MIQLRRLPAEMHTVSSLLHMQNRTCLRKGGARCRERVHDYSRKRCSSSNNTRYEKGTIFKQDYLWSKFSDLRFALFLHFYLGIRPICHSRTFLTKHTTGMLYKSALNWFMLNRFREIHIIFCTGSDFL